MELHTEKEINQNGLEFKTHVCLQCKSCIEDLDQYVAHIKNDGCSKIDEDEYNQLEDLKKKEYHLKKELSTLKNNVIEKEGQLKDVQCKILRQEKTGHKVKAAQLKVKSEELAYSKSEMKQLKLKYNKLLCFLRDKEQGVEQIEKKGDTPEKSKDRKSPKKRESTPTFSKVTSVKFSDKKSSNKKSCTDKRKKSPKEKNTSIDLENDNFNKSEKVLKEPMNVMDSGDLIIACSETVCMNLKESSLVGINPKLSKTNENECIKDKIHTSSIKKGTPILNKPEKLFKFEPMPDYNAESDNCLVTQDEISTFSPSITSDKGSYSVDLYRTKVSCTDTESSEPSMITLRQNLAYKAKDSLDLYRPKKSSNTTDSDSQISNQDKKKIDDNSQQSTMEFRIHRSSRNNLSLVREEPVKSIFKSTESDCQTILSDGNIKVEILENKSKTFINDKDNTNDSVVFLKQLHLPPNTSNIVPRVSTPICKKEKMDFVDPELSAIISEEEITPGGDISIVLLNTDESKVAKHSENNSSCKKSTIKDKIITEKVNNVIDLNDSLEKKIKDQAKDENHNEAMILETDLDNEVLKVNNSIQGLDDKKEESVYSPQDKIETLSDSGGNFLTLSEVSRSPTNNEISLIIHADNIADLDTEKGNHSRNENLRTDTNKEALCLRKDDESETAKSFVGPSPLPEKSSGSQKTNMNKISDYAEKPPTATVKPLNSESSTSTKIDNEASRDKRKLHPECVGNKEKRTRTNTSNAKDGEHHLSNVRRGASSPAVHYGGRVARLRSNYDSNRYPRSGLRPISYQQQQPYHQQWHQPRGTANYRHRMNHPNHYSWNYQW